MSGSLWAWKKLRQKTKLNERSQYGTVKTVDCENCNTDLCTTTKGVQQGTLRASRNEIRLCWYVRGLLNQGTGLQGSKIYVQKKNINRKSNLEESEIGMTTQRDDQADN